LKTFAYTPGCLGSVKEKNNILTVCVLFIQDIYVDSNPLDQVYLLSKESSKENS